MPLEVMRVVGEAFDLVARNWGSFLRTQGVVIALAAVLSVIREAAFPDGTLGGNGLVVSLVASFVDGAPASDPLPWALALISLLLGLLGLALGIVVAQSLMGGTPVRLGEAFRRTRPRFTRFLLATLFPLMVVGFLALAGTLLAPLGWALALPILTPVLHFLPYALGLWLLATWAVAPVVSLVEDQDWGRDFARSSGLTRGGKASVAGALLLVVGATALTAILVTLPLAAFPGAWEGVDARMAVVYGALDLGVELVGAPVLAATLAILYRDLARAPGGGGGDAETAPDLQSLRGPF